MSKEVGVSYIKVLPLHSPGGTEKIHEKTSDFRAEIWNQELSNAKDLGSPQRWSATGNKLQTG